MTVHIKSALPGSSTPPTDVTKSSSVTGSSANISRSDHKHDISTAAGVSVGTANAEGSATSLARSDHTHQVTGLTISSQVQGDVLYHNGSSWVRLPAGTSGYFLKTQGGGANPLWAVMASGPITLDASYDSGGAGAGRSIATDAGSVSIIRPNLTTSVSAGLELENTTAALTGSRTQNSPGVLFKAKAWNGSSSVAMNATIISSPILTGSVAVSSSLAIYTNTNGGANVLTAVLNASTAGQTLHTVGLGTVSKPALGCISYATTGLYYPASNEAAISTDGTLAARWTSGQQMQVPAGSEASPVYSFTTSTTTGFYSPSANQIAVSTAGSQCMLWTGSQSLFKNGTVSLPSMSFVASTSTGVYSPAASQAAVSLAGVQKVLWTGSQMLISDGTVGSPSFSFWDLTNSGLYSPSSNEAAFSANGVQAIKWTSGQQTQVPAGVAGAPSYTWEPNLTTGWYSPAANSISAAVSGSQKISIGTDTYAIVGIEPVGVGSSALGSSSLGWKEIYQTNDTIGFSYAMGVRLANNTAATNGGHQNSPAVLLQGNGWATTGSSSQSVAYLVQTRCTTGTLNSEGGLSFLRSINGAAATDLGGFWYNQEQGDQFILTGADIDADGGFRQTIPFGITAATVATHIPNWINVAVNVWESIIMRRAGSVVGVAIRCDTAFSGTHTATVTIQSSTNGQSWSTLWSNAAALNSTNTRKNYTVIAKDTASRTFVANTWLRASIVTAGTGWVTRRLAVDLYVEE